MTQLVGIADTHHLVAQCPFPDGNVRMQRFRIGFFAERYEIAGRFAVTEIFGERVFGCGGVMLRNSYRDGLQAWPHKVQGSEKLVVGERGGCGDRPKGQRKKKKSAQTLF